MTKIRNTLNNRWNAFMTARRERARIIREMNAYTDSELAELGFSRLDIHAVANGTYRG